jgi:hypothetical protein
MESYASFTHLAKMMTAKKIRLSFDVESWK